MRANISLRPKSKRPLGSINFANHFKDTTNIQRKIGVYAQNCISLFESTDQKLKQIGAAKPDVLDGYSGSLTMLAKEVKRRDLKTIKPHLLFGNAEFIDLESRKFVQEVFECALL